MVYVLLKPDYQIEGGFAALRALVEGISCSWRTTGSHQTSVMRMSKRTAQIIARAGGGCPIPDRRLFAMAFSHDTMSSHIRRHFYHRVSQSHPDPLVRNRWISSSTSILSLNQSPKRKSFFSIDDINQSGQQRTYKTLGDESWGDYSDEGVYGPATYDPSEWDEGDDAHDTPRFDSDPLASGENESNDEYYGKAEYLGKKDRTAEGDYEIEAKVAPPTPASDKLATGSNRQRDESRTSTSDQRREHNKADESSSPKTMFPSIAEVVQRPKSIEEAIPMTHYHPAFGPPRIRSDDDEEPVPRSNSKTENVGTNMRKEIREDSVRGARPPSSSGGTFGTGISYGSTEDRCLELQTELENLEAEIFDLHGKDNEKFNINSPKQVSQVLFGVPGKSTNKDVLEGMATQNPMAKLILRHRQVKSSLSKLQKRLDNRRSGKHVSSVYSRKQMQPSQQQESPQSQPTSKAAVDVDDATNFDSDPLLLVDTSAYIFRAYYSMPPLHRSDGMPVGAVLGFCNMLNRLVLNRLLEDDGEESDRQARKLPRLVLVMDAPGKTIRHEMYPEYKANRPEAPMDLIPQFDLIRRAAEAYGIVQVQAYSYEADDVIATLATMAVDNEDLNDDMVVILSSDKDLMQLVTRQPYNDSDVLDVAEDSTQALSSPSSTTMIHMMDPMTMTLVDHDAVIEKWGVNASQVGDVLALAGDSADNIPGVPGIGPKTAATLLSTFGTLDEIYKNLDQIPQTGRRNKLEENEEIARLSRQLVELERNVPLNQIVCADNDEPVAPNGTLSLLDDLRLKPIDPQRILDFYEEMGFETIKRKLKQRLEQREQRQQRRRQRKDQTPQKRTDNKPYKEWTKSSKNAAATTSRKKFKPRKSVGIPRPEDYQDVPF